MHIHRIIPRHPVATGLVTAAMLAISAAPSDAAVHHTKPPPHHVRPATAHEVSATVLLRGARGPSPVLVSGTV